eukprot:365506-Chlamydomonas_euryale.AAC.6
MAQPVGLSNRKKKSKKEGGKEGGQEGGQRKGGRRPGQGSITDPHRGIVSLGLALALYCPCTQDACVSSNKPGSIQQQQNSRTTRQNPNPLAP